MIMYYPYHYSHRPTYQNTSSTTDGFPETVICQGGLFSRSSNRFSRPPATAIPSLSRPKDSPQAAPSARADTGHPTSTSNSNTQGSQAAEPQARPAMADNNRTTSSPSTIQPQPTQPPAQSQYPQHPFPYPMYPTYPQFPAFQQHSTSGPNSFGQEYHPSQPDHMALTHYSSPHPRMYPYVPPGSHPVSFPPMPTPSSTPGQVPHGGPPAGPYASQPGMPNFPPMGPAHAPMTGIPPTQGPEKLTCNECGRVRSSRYRWKHRSRPGQPPKPNICRKCRKTATDSEGEGRSSGDGKARRRTSRRRHRSRGGNSRPRSRAQSRARSSSRPAHTDYHTYFASDKSSSDTGSSSHEIVPYYKAPIHRSRSRSKRVVYIEAPRDQIALSDSERDVEVRYINPPESGPLIISRPSTPAARLQPTRSSSHQLRAPVVIEHREYYHEPEPSHQLTHTSSTSEFDSRNPYRRVRSVDARDGRYDIGSYGPQEVDRCYEVRTDGASRDQISGKHVRSRGRNRISIDERTDSMPHAPSPPPRRQRSASVRDTPGRHRDLSSEDGGSCRSQARASSKGRRRSEVEGRRYRGVSPPMDDYDWYDKDGMRVRVREI